MTLVAELDTPAVVVDLDVLEANITQMAERVRGSGVSLRPHTKTHKSPAIAVRQLAAGAAGITCAKLGEAEAMVDAALGIDDILIAYPLVGHGKVRRLLDLRERARICVSLDDVAVAEPLGRAVLAAGQPELEVYLEVDTGLGRLGRPPGPPSVALAKDIARLPGIRLLGLLTHAGHAYDARQRSELDAIASREAGDLVATAEQCAAAGVDITEVSVGATPTARAISMVAGVTEQRAGTYVFNDAMMVRLGVATLEECALRVVATVVARPTAERFVIDAGSKTFTSDALVGQPGWGLLDRPDLESTTLSEEHGIGRCGANGPAIGQRVAVVPNHACAVVAMVDVLYGVRQGVVVEEIAVAGRGRVG